MDGNSNVTAPFLKLPDSHQKTAADGSGEGGARGAGWLETLAADAAYTDPAEAKPQPARKPVRDVLFDDAFPLGATSATARRGMRSR